VTGLLQRHYYDTHLSVFRIPITISTILLWPRSSEMRMAPDSAHERSFALYTRPNACPSFSGRRVRGPAYTNIEVDLRGIWHGPHTQQTNGVLRLDGFDEKLYCMSILFDTLVGAGVQRKLQFGFLGYEKGSWSLGDRKLCNPFGMLKKSPATFLYLCLHVSWSHVVRR
jgi:hypothetical protein